MTEKPSAQSPSVVSTRFPYIDRRSLSQAWFSALHIASDGPLPTAERRGTQVATTARTSARAAATSLAMPAPRIERVSGRASAASVAGAEVATRRTLDARAAAAARAAYARARSYPAFRSSLTLAVAGERVHLLIRRDGATLHVVAICRPAIADMVRRALAAADAHLRLRGETVRSSVDVRSSEVRA
ncbi:MAG: hypothetical protein NVS1B2_10380 [Vulcanimicrobiaceae bacterium]